MSLRSGNKRSRDLPPAEIDATDQDTSRAGRRPRSACPPEEKTESGNGMIVGKPEMQESINLLEGENATISETVVQPAGLRYRRYRAVRRIKESHNETIFSLAFNRVDPRFRDVFATVAVNRATVYKNLNNGQISTLQVYIDEDKNESFYACCFSQGPADKGAHPLLAIGGFRGFIKVIDCTKQSVVRILVGHGNHVNDLRIHPIDVALLISASADHSVRMWNIHNGACVAVFAGEEGHRDAVLSCDFDILGEKIVSGGMDRAVKVWCLEDIKKQREVCHDIKKVKTDAPYFQFPIFSTKRVHDNYVDCVRYYGQMIVSKTVETVREKRTTAARDKKKGNDWPAVALAWKPEFDRRLFDGNNLRRNGLLYEVNSKERSIRWKPQKENGEVVVFNEYRIPDCCLWFIRFVVDQELQMMALGNQDGKVHVYDVDQVGNANCISRLSHRLSNSAVRNCAFNHDGSSVLYVCDDATVWRWDLV